MLNAPAVAAGAFGCPRGGLLTSCSRTPYTGRNRLSRSVGQAFYSPHENGTGDYHIALIGTTGRSFTPRMSGVRVPSPPTATYARKAPAVRLAGPLRRGDMSLTPRSRQSASESHPRRRRQSSVAARSVRSPGAPSTLARWPRSQESTDRLPGAPRRAPTHSRSRTRGGERCRTRPRVPPRPRSCARHGSRVDFARLRQESNTAFDAKSVRRDSLDQRAPRRQGTVGGSCSLHRHGHELHEHPDGQGKHAE